MIYAGFLSTIFHYFPSQPSEFKHSTTPGTNLLEFSPLPRLQALDPDRPMRDAHDGLHVVPDALEHAADLPVLALPNDDVDRCQPSPPVIVNHLYDAGPSAGDRSEVNRKDSECGEGGYGERVAYYVACALVTVPLQSTTFPIGCIMASFFHFAYMLRHPQRLSALHDSRWEQERGRRQKVANITMRDSSGQKKGKETKKVGTGLLKPDSRAFVS